MVWTKLWIGIDNYTWIMSKDKFLTMMQWSFSKIEEHLHRNSPLHYPLWATVLLQGDAMAFNLSQHISKNLHERADHSNRLMKFIPCLKLKIHQVLKKTTIESILDYHSTLAASTLFQLYVNMLNFLIKKTLFSKYRVLWRKRNNVLECSQTWNLQNQLIIWMVCWSSKIWHS